MEKNIVTVNVESKVSVHDEDNQWESIGGSITGLDLTSETYPEDKEKALAAYEALLTDKKKIDEKVSGIVVEQDLVERVVQAEKKAALVMRVVDEVKRQKDVIEASELRIAELTLKVQTLEMKSVLREEKKQDE